MGSLKVTSPKGYGNTDTVSSWCRTEVTIMYSCFMGLQVMMRGCKGIGEARRKCGSPPDDIRGAGLGDQASRRGARQASTRQDSVLGELGWPASPILGAVTSRLSLASLQRSVCKNFKVTCFPASLRSPTTLPFLSVNVPVTSFRVDLNPSRSPISPKTGRAPSARVFFTSRITSADAL